LANKKTVKKGPGYEFLEFLVEKLTGLVNFRNLMGVAFLIISFAFYKSCTRVSSEDTPALYESALHFFDVLANALDKTPISFFYSILLTIVFIVVVVTFLYVHRCDKKAMQEAIETKNELMKAVRQRDESQTTTTKNRI